MCFDSTHISPHEEFLIPRPSRSKFNLHPPHMQSNVGTRTCPVNAGTCNPHGLTYLAQDSSRQFILPPSLTKEGALTVHALCWNSAQHNSCFSGHRKGWSWVGIENAQLAHLPWQTLGDSMNCLPNQKIRYIESSPAIVARLVDKPNQQGSKKPQSAALLTKKKATSWPQ